MVKKDRERWAWDVYSLPSSTKLHIIPYFTRKPDDCNRMVLSGCWRWIINHDVLTRLSILCHTQWNFPISTDSNGYISGHHLNIKVAWYFCILYFEAFVYGKSVSATCSYLWHKWLAVHINSLLMEIGLHMHDINSVTYLSLLGEFWKFNTIPESAV